MAVFGSRDWSAAGAFNHHGHCVRFSCRDLQVCTGSQPRVTSGHKHGAGRLRGQLFARESRSRGVAARVARRETRAGRCHNVVLPSDRGLPKQRSDVPQSQFEVHLRRRLSARCPNDFCSHRCLWLRQDNCWRGTVKEAWVKEGEDMRMRCRSCQCREGELTCTLDEGKTCDTYYDPSVDQMCLEWDADECCCLKTGCNVNGTIYDEGEDYVAGETHDGCQTYCTCGKFGTFGACYYVCATPAPVS